MTAPPGDLEVLYRDDALVIVNKPSGLAAHRGMATDARGDYVLTRVRDQIGCHVYLVHRLDRATSGAVALVLDPALVPPLQRAFEARTVDKRYLALLRGVMPQQVSVDYAIPRSEGASERVDAQTEFSRLSVFEERYSLVEVRPLSGRFHQIRRHASHLRHPLIGDTTYGDRHENRRFRERFQLMRLALHAHKLTVPHPVTGECVAVEAKLPDDLGGPLRAMGLWG